MGVLGLRSTVMLAACGVLAGTAGLASAATGPPRPDPSPAAVTSHAATSSAPSPGRPPSARPAPIPSAPQTSPPQTHPVFQPPTAQPPAAQTRPAKRPVVKRPVVKRPVVKRPVVKYPAPAPKPHPISPRVHLAPTGVLPVSRTRSSSGAFVSGIWVLLEIAAALALIGLLLRRRALPVLQLSSRLLLHRAGTNLLAGRRQPRSIGIGGDSQWIYGERMSYDSGQTAAGGAPGRHADSQPGAVDTAQTSASPEDDAKAILAEAESKAQEILAAAEEARERLSSEVLASAEGTALEITAEARRRAEEIVKEGKAKAGEALAEAERNRARTEQERSLLEMKRKRLDELLSNAFEEVRRPTERPLRSVDGPSEAREVREAARDSK